MRKRLSFRKAKLFSLRKWKWFTKNPIAITESAEEYYKRFKRANPKLVSLNGHCGFCERYKNISCSFCELGNSEAGFCDFPNSLFEQWKEFVDYKQLQKAIQTAESIFSVIAKLEKKRYDYRKENAFGYSNS